MILSGYYLPTSEEADDWLHHQLIVDDARITSLRYAEFLRYCLLNSPSEKVFL